MLYPFTGWRRVVMAVLVSPAIVWGWLVWLATGHTVETTVREVPSERGLWRRVRWLVGLDADGEAPR